jgi:surface antigen
MEHSIRTITQTLSHAGSRPAHKVNRRPFARVSKKSRKRLVGSVLLAFNIAVLLGVISFIARSPNSGQAVRQSALINDSVVAASPLDQLSSSDIAVHLAQMASLPETTAVVNQADTISNQMATSSGDNTVVAKPHIVSSSARSNRDILKYVPAPGDTVSAVAAKFGVTSDSIRWSNGLSGNDIPANRELLIPPVNGIVHLVKAGETPEKLAQEYRASADSIISFNDAEVSGLKVGTHIVIPDGTKATQVFNVARYGGFAWGSSAVYGSNGYDYGWCTWYVANKVSVPNNWGNANTWDNGALASGWTVSKVPRPGAIAQTNGPGLGHVAYVEAVSADGTMIKYSDMNGLAGWGRVGYSDWVPVSKFHNYIYR